MRKSCVSFALVAACLAGGVPACRAQAATQSTADTKAQLKEEHKALKDQAKADKKERKALETHAQKKADRAQDKADKDRAKAGPGN